MTKPNEKKDDASKRRRVTIKDIATKVNVSSATVSRVLNMDDTLSVSAEVRRSIIEAAEAMSYTTPSQRKRKSSLKSTRRVALVHSLSPEDEMRDPYYVGMRLGVERRCNEMKLDPRHIRTSELMANPGVLLETAGTILFGWHPEDVVSTAKGVNDKLVVADFQTGVEGVDSVSVSLEKGTRKVVNSVLNQGLTKIGFLGWGGNPQAKNAPEDGRRPHTYATVMRERGLFREDYLRTVAKAEEGGYAGAKELMALPNPPEAIITSNDTMAIGVYRALHEMGLRIPDDVSVVSFNDISLASFLVPPLTTLRIPGEEIGAAAVELLLERLDRRTVSKHTEFETSLIYRESLKLLP